MDNNEEETKKHEWVTNICLRCEKPFVIKDWKLDDVRFKRICNGCKVTNTKNHFKGALTGTAYH